MTSSMNVPGLELEPFNGDFSRFPEWRNKIFIMLRAYSPKIQFRESDKTPTIISGEFVVLLSKVFDLPPPGADPETWGVEALVDAHNEKYPHDQITEVEKGLLDESETTIFVHTPLSKIFEYNSKMVNLILPNISPNLPEVIRKEELDYLSAARMLSTLNAKYRTYVMNNGSRIITETTAKCKWPVGCSKTECLDFLGTVEKNAPFPSKLTLCPVYYRDCNQLYHRVDEI